MGDNVYFSFGCPAKMSDSRLFTDWHPKAMLDAFYMERFQAGNEHEYRKKLQSSGLSIMKENIDYYMNHATCQCKEVSCRKPTQT